MVGTCSLEIMHPLFSQFIDTAMLLLLCAFKVIPWENFWPFVANGFFIWVFFAALILQLFICAVDTCERDMI